MNKPSKFDMRPYTHKELASRYGVGRKTFLKWLKPFQNEIGPRIGHFYSTLQVATIMSKLGWPSMDEDFLHSQIE